MSEEKGFTVRDRRRVKMDGEEAERKEEQSTAEPKEARAQSAAQEAAAGRRRAVLPPVDFTGFTLGLAQMALMHLGEFGEPETGQRSVDLEQARHTIDILSMLGEKTQGNLTEEEAKLLRSLISELKLKYVQVANQKGL